MKFEELRKARRELARAVDVHRESVFAFRHRERPWFLRHTEEKPSEDAVDHLSTTASCLESLADIPDLNRVDGEAELAHQIKANVVREFADAALSRHEDEAVWSSEGAARVYCRVRTLPAILRFAPDDVLATHGAACKELVEFVWARVDPSDFMRQGVAEDPVQEPVAETAVKPGAGGEASADPEADAVAGPDHQLHEPTTASDEGAPEPLAPPRPQAYPPNAFHSYWAIQTLAAYEKRDLPALEEDVASKRKVVHLWAEKALAAQAALIPARAQRLDAHQLAWALATDLMREPEQPATAVSPRRELYEAALKAFFDEQLTNGNWRRYEPLFHYPKAGNAYCYTFETLTELIRPALVRDSGRLLRELLRAYADKLLEAWHFAEATQIELPEPDRQEVAKDCLGWCSGHHAQRTVPEAWATAAVFSYLQVLRRLIGFWTAEAARESLGVARPSNPDPDRAEGKLRERGDSWAEMEKLPDGTQRESLTTARRLAALFLHPTRARRVDDPSIEPDRKLIAKNQGRSAILFGPPGTSKTTLIDALAGAIEWDYLEIHASDFLRKGMDRVPEVADEIFAQLMEIDSCVVLFDEIDELIRQRDKNDSDPFGRFLTTSMLPKIAKLWEQRRLLFFVATNHIDAADPAIRRSQRFDAAIFAAPPSFARKRAEFERYLGQAVPEGLDADAVATALASATMDDDPLGIFALLRWDQLAELADRTQDEARADGISLDAVKKALARMGEDLGRTEWSREDSATVAANGVDGSQEGPYALYRAFVELDRRDYRRQRLIKLDSADANLPERWERFAPNSPYLVLSYDVRNAFSPTEEGTQRIDADGLWRGIDDGLLSFAMTRSADGDA